MSDRDTKGEDAFIEHSGAEFPPVQRHRSQSDASSIKDIDNALSTSQPVNNENEGFGSTAPEHRKFESYHVNLIAIGGTIGTVLYIYMGFGLTAGGPLNLFLGYVYWCSVIWAVAECQKELVTFWPTDVGLARFPSRYVDPALGFALGWNFFISCVALVIFEVTAFGYVMSFWPSTASVSAAATITPILVTYALMNLYSARYFANAEFAAAVWKVLLIISLLAFTFICMLGGNPKNDRFGFQYWKNPGPVTTPYPKHQPRSWALFEGFLAAVFNARVVVAGPDYLTMTAGEARNPRKTMPRAFNSTIYRLIFFFVGGALAMGILCAYNDPELLRQQARGGTGAASPYIIAMQRLEIPVFPDIVNVAILTSIFSAGNAYLFCGSRTLAQMARDGHAPRIFAKRNRNGVPWVAVTAVLAISLLSYLQLSAGSAIVIQYLAGLVGTAQLVSWMSMTLTWIRWNRGLKAQGISRDSLSVFLAGQWSTPSFFFGYGSPIIVIVLFTGWKIWRRTEFARSATMDLKSFVNDPQFTEVFDYSKADNRGKAGQIVHRILSAIF